MLIDPNPLSIGATGIVIGTSTLITVHCSVEIVVFIRTATTVVVQTSILLQLLLRFLVLFLLPSSITSRLTQDQDSINRLLSLTQTKPPLLTPFHMASSNLLSRAANALIVPVAPQPCQPIQISTESMELNYPLTSSLTDSRDTSRSVRQTVDATLNLLIGMTAEEYAKMLDPIVYNPFLERDIIFPTFVPPPLDEQRSNDIMLQGVGSELGELVLKKNVPLYLLQANVHLYLLQANVHLFGCPDLRASEHIHFSRHLSHPISSPLNYVGEDIYVQELHEAFLKNSATFVDGFAYYDEPLASTYEGLGFTFPIQSYHDTMQVPAHNQGFEILRRNLFTYNKAFCQLVLNQTPNETIHSQLVRDFIRDPTTIDRIHGNSDVEHYLDPESNGWDYVLCPHETRPLEGFGEIPTQQFWNHIIDARWRRIWKRKNPWFEAWRELTFTYELDAERSPRVAFAAFTVRLDQYQ
jgi:hypothetical protein